NCAAALSNSAMGSCCYCIKIPASWLRQLQQKTGFSLSLLANNNRTAPGETKSKGLPGSICGDDATSASCVFVLRGNLSICRKHLFSLRLFRCRPLRENHTFFKDLTASPHRE